SPISEAEKISLRSQMGYHENQIIVLCVGAIIKRKGMDLLIKTFQKFKKRHDNALLILVGPIPSSDNKRIRKGYQEYLEIKKLIDDFQLEHFIHLTGTKNNIDEYMKISDFFVFLSRQEGLPNVLLESMSTGLPVITLNRAGVTGYIIRNKIDGIIVDEENPEKIALEMEHLINNDDLYHNISIHSRNTILDRFTDQIIDHQYEEIYEEIS
ncbi:MAG: glycosyltransferase family 4 protein, partial [Candidatus Atribacteria bacterium]|nr:glycosyltransferase family 4 protein [Candidatus Atribacteria bacterium]